MTDYPLVRLVDAPEPSARIRFDFNDGMSWAEHDGFSLGTPPMAGDPGSIGAGYEMRNPRFNLNISGGEAAAMTAQARLARELMRDENWLHFQLSPTAEPMWMRCYRSSPGEFSFANVYQDRTTNRYGITVSLVADPFAVGRQLSPELSIRNDPATGGLSAVLDEIRGDAPAPVILDMDAGSTSYVQPFLSCIPLVEDWPGTVVWQAETFFLGGDTTIEPSGTQVRVLAASPAPLATGARLSASLEVPFTGRWRLFARVRVGITPTDPPTWEVIGAGAGCVKSVRSLLSSNTGDGYRIVELGTYAFPKGNPPTSKPYEIGAGGVILQAGKIAGGSNALIVDYITAIPVDLPLDQAGPGSVTEFVTGAQTAGNVLLRVNGEAERVEELTGGTRHRQSTPETPIGGFLKVTPGATNVLHLLPRRRVSEQVHDDLLGLVTNLTVSYRPRYLWLASS